MQSKSSELDHFGPKAARENESDGQLLAIGKVVPMLRQHRRGAGCATISKLIDVIQMTIRADICLPTHALERQKIRLVADEICRIGVIRSLE